MRSLSEFQGGQQVFQLAKRLPQFFQSNLVDPARVVKSFQNDPQAHIRIFYYQYLKLCFQSQNVNYDAYIHKIEDIINNPEFQFIFSPSDDSSIYNDTQAKSFIMEFFGLLVQDDANVLRALNSFPIMDKIFIHFYRSLLILSSITDSLTSYIQTNRLLEFLKNSFEVDIEVYDRCIKYVETDIFVYQQDIQHVYMAYMDFEYLQHPQSQEQIVNNVNTSYQTPSYSNQPAKVASVQYQNIYKQQFNTKPSRQALAKGSYIAEEFVDFTNQSSFANRLSDKAKTVAQESNQFDKPYQATPSVFANPPKAAPAYTQYKPEVIAQPAKQPQYQPDFQPQLPTYKTNIEAESKSTVSKFESSSSNVQSYLTNTNSYNVQVQSYSSSSNYQKPAPLKDQIKADYWNQLPSFNLPPAKVSPPVQQTFTYQAQNKYTSSNIQPVQPVQTSYKPQSYLPTKDAFTSPKNTNNPPKIAQNDLFYNPKVQNSSYNYTYTSNTAINNYNSPKSDPIKDIKSTTAAYVSTGGKKPFGLNVSEEFSKQEITKHMAEPHRSNVENIRTRARNFRTSLVNTIK